MIETNDLCTKCGSKKNSKNTYVRKSDGKTMTQYRCGKCEYKKELLRKTNNQPNCTCKVCNTQYYMKASKLIVSENHYCSQTCLGKDRETIYLGSQNPNSKYDVDPYFFKNIDSEFKAWLLGWIASDGHISRNSNIITIQIHKKDQDVLKQIKCILGFNDSFIKVYPSKNRVSVSICNKKWKDDICSLLQIQGGKKSHTVKFPALNVELEKHFIRGYFEGDGHISSLAAVEKNKYIPVASIASNSISMLTSIQDKLPCKCGISHNALRLSGSNVVIFLNYIYNNSHHRMQRKFYIFEEVECYKAALLQKGCKGRVNKVRWSKTEINAQPLLKTDNEFYYDFTLIKKIEENDDFVSFDSCLKIRSPKGYVLDVEARLDLQNYGCRLFFADVIDLTYTGSVRVILKKSEKREIKLEDVCNLFQLRMHPLIQGGFGSSGR